MSSAHTLPAKVPAPVPASSGPSALEKFVRDKDWKFYAAVASVTLLTGAGIYYLTRSSDADSDEPRSGKAAKNKKTKNKKKAAKGTSTPDEKGMISLTEPSSLDADNSKPNTSVTHMTCFPFVATTADKASAESDQDVETMSPEAIAKLSQQVTALLCFLRSKMSVFPYTMRIKAYAVGSSSL
jgi:hypothetical protein